MSDDRKELGTRLKEAREYLGLSQDEVARAIKLPRSAISLLEAGQRKVDALELAKLADIYQRPVSDFTGAAAPARAPPAIAHLARAAAKLSDQDRAELMRFAEFLGARAAKGKKP